jgi:signal transduction histidine kinase
MVFFPSDAPLLRRKASMTGAYAYTPHIWPPLVAAIFLAAIGLYAWRRRAVPGGKPFVAMSAVSILILLGIAFEAAAVASTTKIAWYEFQFVLLMAATTPVTCFVLDYAYPGRWLTRRNVFLLSIPPLLCLLMALISDSQLIWRRLEVGADGSLGLTYAPGGALLVAYGLALFLLYTAVFVRLFIRSPQHRWPVALMLIGQISSRAAFLIDNTRLPALSTLDLSVLVIVLPWTMYAVALFGFRILDPLPAARSTALEQMRDGMVVLDAGGHITCLNPTAANVLGTSAARARGKTLAEVLPAFADPTGRLTDGAAGPAEINQGTGPEARYYALEMSVLKDFRGPIIGHLLMLRDVTEQRRAQAQMLAQQWAQAVLQEREQLAIELHDGLSQSLAFLNVQAQAAQLYLQTDQEDAARVSMIRLAEVSREMQADVRELIGSMLTVSLPIDGFCVALHQVVTQFEQRNGMAVALVIDDTAAMLSDPGLLPAPSGVQLIRIVQEALANVRKHAGAPDQIGVQLRVCAGQLQLAITDNGVGFDGAQPGIGDKHFGLEVMRQRTARIGGQLAMHSAPGEGTRVEVSVPVGEEKVPYARVIS